MARLIDYLIKQARAESENEEYGSNYGIQDSEFIEFLNDAQFRLQNKIVAQHQNVFVEEKEITAVASQEAYNIPADSFLDNKVSNVEFSSSGVEDDYYTLRLGTFSSRTPGVEGYPKFYIRKSGKILLAPKPDASGGLIRMNYVRRVKALDKRRATVASATLDSGTRSITALTLDTITDSIDASSLNEHNYICIVDRNGNMKMANIEIDSINSGTGVVTVTSGFTYESGESIVAGDYVVGGRFTTTHSELPDACERYLIKYAAFKALKRDSSVDAGEAAAELSEIENDIITAYSEMTDDITYIPRSRNWEDWD